MEHLRNLYAENRLGCEAVIRHVANRIESIDRGEWPGWNEPGELGDEDD